MPETPVAETPVAETPVAETPVAETPVAETPVAETPVVETPVAETPVAVTPVAVTPEAETSAEETSEAETPEAQAPRAVAEILPEEPAQDEEAPVDGAKAEIIEPIAMILDDTGEEAQGSPQASVKTGEGALARAEKRQEELEREAQKPARPLPTPDPEVVAEVIRRAQDRNRQKARPKVAPKAGQRAGHKAGQKAGQPSPPGAAEPAKKGPPSERDVGGRGKKRTGKTARKRQKRAERARVLEDGLRRDAAAAVREYQAGGALGSAKKRKRKRIRDDGAVEVEEITGGVIEVADNTTLEQLAEAMGVGVNDLILELMEDNILATKNQQIEMSVARKVADSYGFEIKAVIPEEEEIMAEEPDKPEDLVLRAPVVTVMGHVDHGKTSLLDRVRAANVADGEAGGITQHIAAYEVQMPTGRVVFLDTPGHEAFTQMRARGAHVTDVVVLVVAADDGVQPQTIEAIDHARAAEVPIVVAVNKCDKPNAQPDRVRQELTQYELVSEEWGGKTIIRNISATTGDGIDDLMEMLVLESEMLELKANPKKRARGTVVESELDRGQGAVAWVLVQGGTLRLGDYFLCGETYGRVRTMTNSHGVQVTEAGPSTPVLVTGLTDTAVASDTFIVCEAERVARNVAAQRADLSRLRRGPTAKHMTLEDFHERMQGEDQKTLQIIIKADVQGSMDVLDSSLSHLGNQEVGVRIVHSGVGGITESDVLLASASDAIIIGFHVTAYARVQKLAEVEGVEIRTYRVIYEAMDEIRKALEGMLTPDTKEVITGHAEVRQVFRSSALGNIAGCQQLDGESQRGALARLIRDAVVVHEGRIGSLRRERDDVRSVSEGYECGIKLERYDDIQEGDVIETYRTEEVAKKLV